ncbi:MAG: PAS domain S-box protein, partial [Ignavibacteriales bacterium]
MIIVELLYNLSILVVLSVLSGFIDARFTRKETKGQILQGILFGLTAIIGMMNPYVLTEGIIFDGRSIVISLCALFFGPVSGVITSALSIIYRMYLGGSGVLMGILVILSSFLIGIYFHHLYLKSNQKKITDFNLYLFGLVVHIAMLLLVLALPTKNIIDTYKIISITVLGIFPVVSFLIGKTLLSTLNNNTYLKDLKDSETRYSRIVSAANEGIWVFDEKEKTSFINTRLTELLGYTSDEMIGLPMSNFVHPDDLTDHHKQMNERRDGQKGYYERRFIKKDNSVIWMIVSAVPMNDDSGKYSGSFGMLTDISKQKIIEQKQRKIENLLLQTQRLAKVGGWEWNVVENQMYWTEECYRIHDVERNEIETSSTDHILKSLSCYSETDRPTVMAAFTNCLNNGIPYDLVFPFTTYKDRSIWIRTVAKPVLEDGRVVQVIGSIIDITDQKISEEALRKSEERWQFALEGSNDGVWDWNINTNEVYFSSRWKEMLGFSDNEILNEIGEWEKRIHPQDLEYVKDELQKYFRGELPNYDLEHRLLCKDGLYKYVLARGKVMKRNLDGSPARMVGTHKDITEQKHSEDIIKRSERLLKLFIENSPAAIAMFDREMNYIIASKRYIEDFNIKLENIIGISHYDVFPYMSERLKKIHKHCLEGAIEKCAEDTFPQSNGKIDWVKWELQPWFEHNGEIGGLIFFSEVITDRKNAEEKIKQKDLEFRKLSSNVSDMIFQFTRRPDGTYFVPIASEGIKNIFGCSPEDVLEDFTPIVKVILSEDIDRVIEDIEYSAKNFSKFDCEFRVQIPGKSIQYIYAKSTPERLDDGSITWFGFNADVTERKQAEQEIIENREKFKQLFTSLHDGFALHEILVDKNGRPVDYRFLEANPAYENMTGLKVSEIIGRTVREIIPTIENYWIEIYGKVALTGKPVKFENYVHQLKKHFRIHAYSPSKNKFACITEDITEAKKSETKINQLSLAVEQSPVIVIITDTKGIIEYVNPKFTELTQYTFEEAIGKSPAILKSGHTTEAEYKEMWQTILFGNEWSGIFHNKKKDGQMFWESAKISPIRNSVGKITHFVALKEDITQRVEIEKELEEYRNSLELIVARRTNEIERINKELLSEIEKKKQTEILLHQSLEKEKELNQLKSRFISTASHEFRTPLTSILSSAELIQRYGKKWDEEKYQEHLNRITNSVEYLTELMDDVLTVSRIESGKIQL